VGLVTSGPHSSACFYYNINIIIVSTDVAAELEERSKERIWVESEVKVAQSCPTLCHPMDYTYSMERDGRDLSDEKSKKQRKTAEKSRISVKTDIIDESGSQGRVF